MAIRLKHNVLVQLSTDTAGDKKLYYPDSSAVIIDSFDHQTTKNVQVAAAASEAMNLSDVTDVRGVYLEVDGDIDVIIDGSATPISLTREPGAGTGDVARLFLEASISSITLDNTGGAAAVNGLLVLWGDPTP